MNKKNKITLGILGVIVTAGILTSCNSFCSNDDTSRFRYAYDPINTRYFESKDDAKKYIVNEFKKTESLKNDSNLSFENLKFYSFSEETNKNELTTITEELEGDIFGVYGQTTYLKPTNLFYEYTIKNDGKDEKKLEKITVGLSDFTIEMLNSASSQGLYTPSYTYFEELDKLLMDKMILNIDQFDWLEEREITKENVTFEDIYGYSYSDYQDYIKDPTEEKLNKLIGEDDGKGNPIKNNDGEYLYGRNYSLLTSLGYLKYNYEVEENAEFDPWKQLTIWNSEIIKKIGQDQGMTRNYFNLYKNNINNKVAALKTCISINDGFYGNVSDNILDDTVRIEGKAINFWEGWGNAFTRHGFLEGLLVYPISYMVESFSHSFGMNGWGQIGAVLLVTLIVRGLFMLITFPSTLSTQKMQYLQPELAKLQQRYPNYNTNDYEKQKFAQAQMALYKKHKVHPFSSILVLIIQFPIFISVWNGLTGSASLSKDAVLGLRLSDTIWSSLSNVAGWPNLSGWRTALVLILLMSAAQILAMLLPQILSKKRTKNVQKLGANPAQTSQQKQMKWIQRIMTAFIIFMGFSLPSAMGVYWLFGAIFSAIQTLIMHFILVKKDKRKEK